MSKLVGLRVMLTARTLSSARDTDVDLQMHTQTMIYISSSIYVYMIYMRIKIDIPSKRHRHMSTSLIFHVVTRLFIDLHLLSSLVSTWTAGSEVVQPAHALSPFLSYNMELR